MRFISYFWPSWATSVLYFAREGRKETSGSPKVLFREKAALWKTGSCTRPHAFRRASALKNSAPVNLFNFEQPSFSRTGQTGHQLFLLGSSTWAYILFDELILPGHIFKLQPTTAFKNPFTQLFQDSFPNKKKGIIIYSVIFQIPIRIQCNCVQVRY